MKKGRGVDEERKKEHRSWGGEEGGGTLEKVKIRMRKDYLNW
jgi:hypothetical protein